MGDRGNPYRSDVPRAGPFYGRTQELDRLEQALRSGRRALGAVMGGRGMGKSSLAIELRDRLSDEGTRVHFIRRPGNGPDGLRRQLEELLAFPLDPTLFVDALVQAVDATG